MQKIMAVAGTVAILAAVAGAVVWLRLNRVACETPSVIQSLSDEWQLIPGNEGDRITPNNVRKVTQLSKGPDGLLSCLVTADTRRFPYGVLLRFESTSSGRISIQRAHDVMKPIE